jgi:biopolymer transport protein ExbD
MRRHGTKKQEEAEVNVTPMLDIVFIMLIFFIVTASFVREKGLDVTRPPETPDIPKISEKAILIQINDNDDVFVNRRQVDVRAVRANVERLRAENPKSTVVIQTGRRASTGMLVDVMDQAKQAKASITIAPLEEQGT